MLLVLTEQVAALTRHVETTQCLPNPQPAHYTRMPSFISNFIYLPLHTPTHMHMHVFVFAGPLLGLQRGLSPAPQEDYDGHLAAPCWISELLSARSHEWVQPLSKLASPRPALQALLANWNPRYVA